MENFLVIGSKSNLASYFLSLFPSSVGLNKSQCDITQQDSIEKSIAKFKGRYVLNCAAITDLEECERNKIGCFNVNTLGVFNLNNACLKKDKKLIQLSSNYALNPVNTYGISKYLAEKMVDKKFLIIRTSFYDKNYYLIKNLLHNKNVGAYTNVYFNPVSSYTVVRKIYENKDKKGLINLFSKDRITNYQFAKQFAVLFGINKRLIRKVKFSNTESNLKRPLNSLIRSDYDINLKDDLLEFKKLIR